jgi:nucleotide-binding universal stress UspA family protein
MYSRILVTLEHSKSDAAILAHVRALAKHCGSAVILIHVADGWAARNVNALTLRESEEIRGDREYIERCRAELEADGITTDAVLASGNPSEEIVAAAEREKVDLIAMATHGHRFLNDLFRGTVATEVRHRTFVPVLLVRSPMQAAP